MQISQHAALSNFPRAFVKETEMKLCPLCKTQYSDDSLIYCLQDGSMLNGGRDTVEEVTVVRGNGPADPSIWPTEVVPQPTSRSSNTALTVFLTAAGMLLFFSVAGLAGFLYWRSVQPSSDELGSKAVNSNQASDASKSVQSSPTPKPASSRSASPTPANQNASNALDPQIRNEISQKLNDWKSDAESMDFDSYMNHYADRVDYYQKSGASLSTVRADKQRAFERYSSIRVQLSNLSFTADRNGTEATAIFDKEWDFEGDGDSSGKVQQMMRFSKVNGEWRITAEKDLKLYYKN